MQDTGQALAQRPQASHLVVSLCTKPRKRSGMTCRSSGYCSVTGFFQMCLMVIDIPTRALLTAWYMSVKY